MTSFLWPPQITLSRLLKWQVVKLTRHDCTHLPAKSVKAYLEFLSVLWKTYTIHFNNGMFSFVYNYIVYLGHDSHMLFDLIFMSQLHSNFTLFLAYDLAFQLRVSTWIFFHFFLPDTMVTMQTIFSIHCHFAQLWNR